MARAAGRGSPGDAKRVAGKIVAHCEKTGETLTAELTQKFVDKDLGVDRQHQRAERAAALLDEKPTLDEYLFRHSGTLDGIREVLQAVPDDGWETVTEEHSREIDEFVRKAGELSAFVANQQQHGFDRAYCRSRLIEWRSRWQGECQTVSDAEYLHELAIQLVEDTSVFIEWRRENSHVLDPAKPPAVQTRPNAKWRAGDRHADQ